MNDVYPMNTVDRRTRERMDVQERILNAARELFAGRGFEAVTMRQIADAIEYTPGAIYVYFKDKRELMLALCRHDFESFESQMRELSRHEHDPLARICKMGQAYLAFAFAHPRHYELMFMTKFPADVELPPEELAKMQDPEQNAYAFLGLCVREAMAQGLLRADLRDPDLVTQTLWMALHGVAAASITFAGDPCMKLESPPERGGTEMRRTLMYGLVRDPRRVEELFAGDDHTGAAGQGGAGGAA